MKLNLQLRKDGNIYIGDGDVRLGPDRIKAILSDHLPAGVVVDYCNSKNDDFTIDVNFGRHRWDSHPDLQDYCSGMSSIAFFQQEVQALIDQIRAWYNALPEDEAEVEFS